MERKLGEVFEYKGHKLKVQEGEFCDECYFYEKCYDATDIAGDCNHQFRKDKTSVIFKEEK